VLAHVSDDAVEYAARVAVGRLDEQRHFLPRPTRRGARGRRPRIDRQNRSSRMRHAGRLQ
jgi:hypothetical protein